MLADVAVEQPAQAAIGQRLLGEADVAPGGGREMQRIVVALAAPGHAIGRQIVPLLAGDFTRLAADAERGVGKEPGGLLGGWRLRPAEALDQMPYPRSCADLCVGNDVHASLPSGCAVGGVPGIGPCWA